MWSHIYIEVHGVSYHIEWNQTFFTMESLILAQDER
jgi:hypothetical protein